MFLLQIHPNDDVMKITGVRIVNDNEEFNDKQFTKVKEETYNKVKDNLDGYEMSYPIHVATPLINHIEMAKYKSFESYKNDVLSDYRKTQLDIHMDSDFYIATIQFITLNNELIYKGFVFTEDNREEMYLKLLNTGDSDLIEKLERYLLAVDEIGQYKFHLNEYLKFKGKIGQSKNITHARKIVKENKKQAKENKK